MSLASLSSSCTFLAAACVASDPECLLYPLQHNATSTFLDEQIPAQRIEIVSAIGASRCSLYTCKPILGGPRVESHVMILRSEAWLDQPQRLDLTLDPTGIAAAAVPSV